MSAPLVRTRQPGIYRRGSRYTVVYRDPSGRQRRKSARTFAEARSLKAAFRADVDRGEYRELSNVTFADYAREWIETFTGRTTRGIRDTTKDEYRRDLGLDEKGEAIAGGAVEFFGNRKLASIEPRDIKRYAAHLAARGLACRRCFGREGRRQSCRLCSCTGRRPGRLAQNTIRLALAPLKALFATAVEDGLIRSNPAAGVRIPVRQEEPEERIKALTDEELRCLLGEIPERWRLFFELLAETGLRIGEAAAVTWADLDVGRRRIHVRRRLYRGSIGPPKSKYGRRAIPISRRLARALSARWNETIPTPEEPMFPTEVRTMLDASNVMGRVLKPAARRAGVPWVGFHTFRHTCATILFRRGLNAKQVQVWLGHHSPAFTLATYVHLLPDDLPDSPFDMEATVAPAEPVEDQIEASVA